MVLSQKASMQKIPSLHKELEQHQTILFLVPSISYNDICLETMKQLKGRICYVTVNKTCATLTETFQKTKIKTENILFIDGISRMIKDKNEERTNCYYINSPGALTEFALTIHESLQYTFDYLVFDNITNLLVYQEKSSIERSMQDIISKIKMTKTKAIFYAIPIKEHEELIKEICLFVDKVVRIQ